MNNSLAIAVIGGLGGMLGWGLADFFAKKTVDRVGDIVSLVWAHFFGSLIFFTIVIYSVLVTDQIPPIPRSFSNWGGLAFFGVLQMIVYWLVYKAFSKGKLAILNPLFASYSGLVALISVTLLGEKINHLAVIGLFTIFGGILLMNIDIAGLRRRRLNIVPGLKEIIAASILAAGWTLGWDRFVSGQNVLSYALIMYVFMSLAALVLAKRKKVKLGSVPPHLWKFLVFIGLGEVVAYLSITLGFSKTSLTSVVALISGAFSVPTVVLAHVLLKERISKLQELAVVAIIVGVIIISLR